MPVDALPVERTSFVGRERDLATLTRVVRGGARLVTIGGPAGIGKTRVLVLLGAGLADELGTEGGVWLCDLARARSEEDVVSAVAAALGVLAPPGEELAVRARDLGCAIDSRGRTLILLDNFEQVAAHAPATVGAWLSLAPDAVFAATSREWLGVEGEVRHELGPLDEGAGVELFSARAISAGARAFDSSAKRDVAEIVGSLEGNPLAIELAAARASMMTLAELRDRLAQRLDFLRAQRRDVPPRQRTLRAAMEWSWTLLAVHEQRALAQASMFASAFTLAAAEGVLDLGEGAPPVVDVLQALRDKSLLRTVEHASGATEVRFRLYEAVREYGREALAAMGDGALDAARRRHAGFYDASGAAAAAEASGRDGAAARERIRRDLDDLVLAHACMLEHDTAAAVRVALALEPVLTTRGPVDRYIAVLDASIAACRRGAGARSAPGPLARALCARGDVLLRIRGRHADAEHDLAEALRLAREAGDLAVEGDALGALGFVLVTRGRTEEGRACSEQALAIHRSLGDTRQQGLDRVRIGLASIHERRLDEARPHLVEALALLRDAGDRRSEGMVLTNLGGVEHDLGRLDAARELYAQALEVVREVGDRRFEARVLYNYGSSEHELGRLGEARDWLERSALCAREVGDRFEVMPLLGLAILAVERGDREEARRAARHARSVRSDTASPRLDAFCFAVEGAAAAARDDEVLARDAFRRARESARAAGDPGPVAAVDVLEGLADLAAARAASRSGDSSSMAAHEAAARARVATARSPGNDGGAAPTARLAETRLYLRLLDRALEPGPAPTTTGDERRPGALRLEIAADASRFRVAGASEVDLSRRKPTRRVLRALLERRLAAPGEAMSPEAILAAAWPGERVLRDAGASRVYVAIATLRRMGLDGVLVTHGDGYLLHAAVMVHVID